VSPRRPFGRRTSAPAPTRAAGADADRNGDPPAGAPRPLLQPPPRSDASPQPQFRGPLEAAYRHRGLVIVPIVVLVAAAAVIGLLRNPTYEAESRISVGRVDAPVYTLDEVLIANTTLARNYARLAEAAPVARPAAREVGLTQDEAVDRVLASQVPGTSLIGIEAEGESEDEAIALANATAERLIAYVEELNLAQEGTNLLNRFRNAARDYGAAQERLQRLQRRKASRTAIRRAQLNFFTEQARTEAARIQYRNNEGGLPAQGLLQLALPAAQADSDRASVMQLLLLFGFGGGLVIGLGLALVRANRGLLSRRSA
jgi:hypothetical protein